MHHGVPPSISQMNGMPHRSLEQQPSAPQDSCGREVARVAGRLDSLHRGVRERSGQEQTSDHGSKSTAPVVDVNGVGDLCTGRGVPLKLSHADDSECGLRRPDQTGPLWALPQGCCLGHEGAGILTSIRPSGLKPTGLLLRGPFVDTISVCRLDRAKDHDQTVAVIVSGHG